MRLPMLVLAFAAVSTLFPAAAQTAAPAGRLTLAEAVRLAETASKTVRTAEAQLAAVEGERREAASPFFKNPELSIEGSRRQAPDTDSRESSIGLAQPLEIAGQQGYRRSAAAAALEAVRAEVEEAKRQARADAAKLFYNVLASQRRLQVEQRSVELFDRTSQAVARRRAAGEDTRLDANVALIEAERARNALARAREQLVDARAEIATLLLMPLAALPELSGELAPPVDRVPYTLDQLLASGESLPRLRALAARQQAARARLDLARAGRYPDVTVGVNVGREGPADARERVTTFGITLPLPIFNRNDAAIGQALTDSTQAELELAAMTRNASAQVQRLWTRLQIQRERVQRLQHTMLAASTDNQQLSARSRQAGQIGLLEQLIVNRQALDAERDLIDALVEYHATRIELENAAGWSQEGTLQ